MQLIAGIVTENQFITVLSNGVKNAALYLPRIFCQRVFVVACVMGIDVGRSGGGGSYWKSYKQHTSSCSTTYHKHKKSVKVMDTQRFCVFVDALYPS